jgi:DNA-binding PadR family transcriptional regulator
MGNKMSLEVEAQILSIVKKHPAGVRELSRIMRRRTQTVVSTIKRMNATGLVDLKPEKTHSKGRPRLIISATALGDDYLDTYRRLLGKPLRSSRNDLLKANRDAEYVERLISRGKDPYEAFMELNVVVRYS